MKFKVYTDGIELQNHNDYVNDKFQAISEDVQVCNFTGHLDSEGNEIYAGDSVVANRKTVHTVYDMTSKGTTKYFITNDEKRVIPLESIKEIDVVRSQYLKRSVK